MNTFHISPSDALAQVAAIEVIDLMAKRGNGVLIAVRGQTIHWATEDNEDMLYTVCEAPEDCTENGGNTDYIWTYVPAAKWLGKYRKLHPIA